MNDIQIFSNPQFGEVRTAINSLGEIEFCAADVCKALGYANGRDAIAKHVDNGDVAKRDTPTTSGVQLITFVNESGLYALIFGSKLEKAKEFKHWVTSEVLPTIRKTGSYSLAVPKTFSEALRLAAAQAEQIEEQQKLIAAQGQIICDLNEANAEMRVKVSYYDQILASKLTVTTTQIAQDYGMSAKKFNVELRNLHIQRKVGGQWILYAPYNTMGYVHSETFIPDNSTTGKVIMTTKWTQKGRLFLYDTLKKNGILPLIER